MPCYDPPTPEHEIRARYQEEFTHNSMVAEFLCEAMALIERSGLIYHTSLPVQDWYVEHKKRDKEVAKRKAAEAEKARKRKEALDLLSPEQRRLLGLS